MREWDLRRLYKDSFTFRWTVRSLFFALIVTLLIFGYQEWQGKKDRKFIKEEFLKTQEICSRNEAKCSDKETIEKLNKYDELSLDFYARGKLAFNGKKYNEARYFYDLVSQTDSAIKEDPNFWYEYSIILEAQRDYGSDILALERSLEAAKKGVQINGSIKILNRLGYLYHSLGFLTKDSSLYKKAIETCDIILNINESDYHGLMCKVYAAKVLNDNELFLDTIGRVVDLFPANDEVISTYAFYLFEKGKYQDSYELLYKLKDIPKDKFYSVERYYNIKIIRAMALKELGLINNSEEVIKKACDEMNSIQSELNLRDFRWDEESLGDINVTVGDENNCDGYYLLNVLNLLQRGGLNAGRCYDPYDQDISENKCPTD